MDASIQDMGDGEPDTLSKIADDIEAAKSWCDGNGKYGTGVSSITELTLGRWADRIRNIDLALDVTDKVAWLIGKTNKEG